MRLYGTPTVLRLVLGLAHAVKNKDVLDHELVSGYLRANLSDRTSGRRPARFIAGQVDPENNRWTTAVLDDLRHFNQPTLLLWGGDDPHFGPQWAERLRHDIPGVVDLQVLPDTGHLLMEERPGDVAQHILSFLTTPHPAAAVSGRSPSPCRRTRQPGSGDEAGLRPRLPLVSTTGSEDCKTRKNRSRRRLVDRLVALGRFDTATAVFELGCGTGSLANDSSTTICRRTPPTSASRSADGWRPSAGSGLSPGPPEPRAIQTDGRLPLPVEEASADRFIAAYVFDLLPHDYALQVIASSPILKPGGLLCVTSLTRGETPLARIVSSSWLGVWRIAPPRRRVPTHRPRAAA